MGSRVSRSQDPSLQGIPGNCNTTTPARAATSAASSRASRHRAPEKHYWVLWRHSPAEDTSLSGEFIRI
jgi:hypothetical protein